MPDDLRPEVVAALSEPVHLPAELVDQVLDASDAERARIGADRNQEAADTQLEPSHGGRSADSPNTSPPKVAGR